MQRAGGYVAHVGIGDVIGLHLPEHIAIDAHLAVSAILPAGMNAEESELAEGKAHAEGGKDHHGKQKYKSLEESRHTHHRGGLQGNRPHTL